MQKLYFKYGTMGSSKSAQALMCKFNYEQKGIKVLLLKPALDTRDENGEGFKVRSRIGLSASCKTFDTSDNLWERFNDFNADGEIGCVIVDEAQFCTSAQVDQLKQVTTKVPVLCYGLLTDFTCHLFEGSKRLVELADSMTEIKSICRCGRKSSINARFVDGKCVDDGPTVLIGGDESYENMCYWCWQKELNKSKK